MFNFFNKIFKTNKKEKTNELGIKNGDRFYSEYFKSYGTVEDFISDDEWYFRLDNERGIFHARARPSELKWIKENNNETN